MKSRGKAWFFTLLVIFLIVGGAMFASYIIGGLPSLEELENPKPALATKVYSIDGEVIDKYFQENRTRINSIDSVPPAIVKALIATEDRNFYSHWGVNLRRTIQVVLGN